MKVRATEVLEKYAEQASGLMEKLMAFEFKPDSMKGLRLFKSSEVASLFGVTDGYLRKLVKQGDIPSGTMAKNNRRLFSLSDIHEIRRILALTNQAKYDPIKVARDAGVYKVIGCPNFKGGVAKTTTAVHLAQYLCLHGYRVLFVDLDPQASATCLFGYLPNVNINPEDTLQPWFERFHRNFRYDVRPNDLSYCVLETNWSGVDLIPSNLALGHADFALSTTSMEGFNWWRQLQLGIETISPNYDVVIIDFPPSLGYLSINAVYAADGLIVPIPPGMLDFASASSFFDMLYDVAEMVEAQDGKDFEFDFIKILMTKVEGKLEDSAEGSDDPLEYLLTDNKAREQKRLKAYLMTAFGDAVLHSEMLNSEAIREATRKFQTVLEIENPECSRSTFKRCFESLESVHKEIEALIRSSLIATVKTMEVSHAKN